MSEHPASSDVRLELDRILASDVFTRSERLSAFSTFIVERTLAGEGDTLKEQVKPDAVASYDIATGRVTELGILDADVSRYFARRFLSVSPDGRWAMFPHVDRYDRDILVLDNFR